MKMEYKWLVLLVVMVGTMMSALDSSIVNVSIPSIMSNLGVGIDDVEWVVTAYMLAFAVFMPLTSLFRERVGSKILYQSGLIIFTIGSIFCGLAWDLPSLIGARVLQAIGGGIITPISMSMISEVFDPKERGKAIGFWGLGILLGPAIGPTLGGLITKFWGWRWIFWVNLPVGIFGAWIAWYYLKDDHPSLNEGKMIRKRKIDFAGLFFITLFLTTLLLALSKGEHEGWHSRYIISMVIIAILSLILFLVAELWVEEEDRIMNLKLFSYPVFTIASIVIFARSVSLFGGVFILPLLLQRQMGFDEIDSGLILLPGALMVGICMPIGGKIGDIFGPAYPTLVGVILLSLFMWLYHDVEMYSTKWDIIFPTLIRGLGMGLLLAPVTATALNTVPREQAAMASSMINIIQQIGGSFGIAVLATILGHRTTFHLNHLSAAVDLSSPLLKQSLSSLYHTIHTMGPSRGDAGLISHVTLVKGIASKSSLYAFRDTFIFGAGMVILAVVPAIFLPKKNSFHQGDKQNVTQIME